MRRLAAILTIAATPYLGCSDRGADLSSAFVSSTWSLQRIEVSGSPPIIIPPSETYTLEFRTPNVLGGVSHCNTYEAQYGLPSGGSISIQDIISTEIACRPPTHDGEFQALLHEATSVQLLGNELRLSNTDNTQVLFFVRHQ
jgi:heat shock protein HslJ